MLDRERLGGCEVCDAGRSLDPAAGPDGHCDRPRNAGRDDGFELILQRGHG
jgi:hypothetical protein